MKQEVGQSTAIDREAYERPAQGRESIPPPLDGWEDATPHDQQRRPACGPLASLDIGRALSWPMAERERAARALATSERRAQTLIDANVIGVAFTDGERLTEANDAFLRTVGWSRADLEAGCLRWQDIAPPAYRDLDERCLTELEQRGECAPAEQEYQRKDGTCVPVLVGVTLVKRAPLECVAFIVDLTAGKHLEADLRASEGHLRTLETELQQAGEQRQQLLLAAVEASRVKDDFLATLAHELRSPLSAILLWMRLLHDTEGAAHAVDAVERNVRLLSRLVEDVLDATRIASGTLSVHMTRVDLRAIVATALDAVGPAAERKHLQLGSLLDRREMTVEGDPVRLEQILNNLLTNAIKFTPGGGRITVELCRVGSSARITVSDTGRGIAPAFLPRVFERFQQEDVPSGARHDGLGLGLGIVRYLVERHGGTIAAASPGLGRGATFAVTLPLAAPVGPAADGSSAPAA